MSTVSLRSSGQYSEIYVADVHNLQSLKNIRLVVSQWHKQAEALLEHLESDWTTNMSEIRKLSEYKSVADMLEMDLSLYERLRNLPTKTDEKRLLAAIDKEGNLQGVAKIEFRKSRKNNNPFVEVTSLLTAFRNMGSKSIRKVRGAGSALIARAAMLFGKTKLVFVDSLPCARAFYTTIGFIPTNRQETFFSYKLLEGDIPKLMETYARGLVVLSDTAPKINTDISEGDKPKEKDEEKQQADGTADN